MYDVPVMIISSTYILQYTTYYYILPIYIYNNKTKNKTYRTSTSLAAGTLLDMNSNHAFRVGGRYSCSLQLKNRGSMK